jgi:hypothetical protein
MGGRVDSPAYGPKKPGACKDVINKFMISKKTAAKTLGLTTQIPYTLVR